MNRTNQTPSELNCCIFQPVWIFGNADNAKPTQWFVKNNLESSFQNIQLDKRKKSRSEIFCLHEKLICDCEVIFIG